MKKIQEIIIDLNKQKENMDYGIYEERITKAHNVIIKEFEKHLLKEKLSNKTINRHVNHVDTFINCYLPSYSYTENVFEAYKNFDDFFGYWLITKYINTSKNLINNMISSLKKFYQFLYENDCISQEILSFTLFALKEGKEMWLDDLKQFEDGTYFSQFD